MKTLVAGCDASGKSTFLENVTTTYGDTVGESSRSDEAQAFKRASLSCPVDSAFIDQRESLYLGLSRQSLVTMSSVEGNVVTTDSALVTRLSHNVMRELIGERGLSDVEIIDAWLHDEAEVAATPPNVFVLTHAAPATIRGRIVSRQQAGDKNEKFWGFNSPYFLEAYQRRWISLFGELSRQSFNCLMFNTDEVKPEDMISTYHLVRSLTAED